MGITLDKIDGRVLCTKSCTYRHDEGSTTFVKGESYYYFSELKYQIDLRNRGHYDFEISELDEECMWVWKDGDSGIRFITKDKQNSIYNNLEMFKDFFIDKKVLLNKKLKKINDNQQG